MFYQQRLKSACINTKSDHSLFLSLEYSITIRLLGVSKLKTRLHRLILVYTCQHVTLLEITFFSFIYFVAIFNDSGSRVSMLMFLPKFMKNVTIGFQNCIFPKSLYLSTHSFAGASSHVVHFNTCNKLLTQRLLKQGYWFHKLQKPFF